MHYLHQALIQKFLWARLVLCIFACLLLAGFLFFASPAFAQADPIAEEFGLNTSFQQVGVAGSSDIKGIIANIINITLGFLGIVAVIIILYAGYMWMTAGGNEEKVSKAKLILRNAIIGLVIILASWGIAAFIMSKLGDATGVGGGIGANCSSDFPDSCIPDNSFCASGLECSALCTCQLPVVGLTPDPFKIKYFQTSHDGAAGPYDDVYLCSQVDSVFNEMLNQESVIDAWLDGAGELKIVQISDADVPLDTPIVMTAHMASAGNVIGISPREGDNEWPSNGTFELYIPKTIKGVSKRFLDECLRAGSRCNDRGTYFSWSFITTNKKDLVDPVLESAYPPSPPEPEDENVNRSFTFSLNFSEAINMIPFVDGTTFKAGSTNVLVNQLDGQAGAVVRQIPLANFNVRKTSTGLYFNLNASEISDYDGLPAHFNPYTWYRITVQNITDMCGRTMSPTPVVWEFKTNGVSAGVYGTYPPHEFANTCPSAETFIQFRTSMYDIIEDSCAVGVGASTGLVDDGLGILERTILAVAPHGEEGGDLNIGGAWDPSNPNKYCRIYDFTPKTNLLDVGTTYTPIVTYKASPSATPIKFNQAGDEWEFIVTPADRCANPPYIKSINPVEGAWGQCTTIRGLYLGTSGDVKSKLVLDEDPNDAAKRRNRGVVISDTNVIDYWETGLGKPGIIFSEVPVWDESYVIADIEDLSDKAGVLLHQDVDLDINVAITTELDVDGDGSGDTPWTSNSVPYWVKDSNIGPCLYSVSPARGYWGESVTLHGKNLGAGAGSDKVTFYDNKFKTALDVSSEGGSWHNKRIDVKVPQYSSENPGPEGEVFVEVDSIMSNALEFFLAGRVGQACSTLNTDFPDADPDAAICTTPDNSVCAQGLECSLNTCLCQAPARFEVRNPQPFACTDSCNTAEISFETNNPMDLATLTATNVVLNDCTADDCAWDKVSSIVGGYTLSAEAGNQRVVIAPASGSLALGSCYRIVVNGGAAGLKDNEEKDLYNINFDSNGDGNIDSYSWSFCTGDSICTPERINVVPRSSFLYGGDTESFEVVPYGPPNSCSERGQRLNPEDLSGTFAWQAKKRTQGEIAQDQCFNAEVDSEPAITITNPDNPYTALAEIDSSITGPNKQAWMCASYAGAPTVKNGSSLILKPLCNSDFDCNQVGALGIIDSNYDNGDIEEAFVFDGIDDYIDVGNDSSIRNSMTNMTISAWVKLDVVLGNNNTNYPIFSNELFGHSGYLFRIEDTTFPPTSGKILIRTNQHLSIDQVRADAGSFPNDKKWHHIVARKRGTEGKIFVDGSEVDSYELTGPLDNPTSNTENGFIGREASQYFKGSMDDLRIYNTDLTDAQISELYNKGNHGSDLAAHWQFDALDVDIVNGTLQDVAGANHGTLENMNIGNWCPFSTCNLDTQFCTPAINDFNPKDGAQDTLVTVKGCYFGNEPGSVDIAKDGDGNPQPANQPDIAWCGDTWTNAQVIVKTDPRAVYVGKVIVHTDRGVSNPALSGDFDPNGPDRPGICNLIPSRGESGDIIEVRGQNFDDFAIFESGNISTYNVTLRDSSPADHRTRLVVDEATEPACPTAGWSDNHICIRVDSGAAAGDAVIKVVSNAQNSNPAAFEVLGVEPRPSGAGDLSVTSYMPGKDNLACQNMVVEVNLNGDLNIGGASIGVGISVPHDAAALANSNFQLQKSDGTIIEGIIEAESFSTRSRLKFIPTIPLDLEQNYKIVLKGGITGLRSNSGGILISKAGDDCDPLVGDDCEIPFKTVNASEQSAQCLVKGLDINPSSPVFTCAGRDDCEQDSNNAAAGHQRVFSAEPVTQKGQLVTYPSGMFGYWNMDENFTGLEDDNVKDVSGAGNHVTITDMDPLALEPGIAGQALRFDSTAGAEGDRIWKVLDTPYEIGSQVTFSAWFKTSSDPVGTGFPYLVVADATGDWQSDSGIIFSSGSGGHMQTRVSCEDHTNQSGVVSTSIGYNDDNWHHAVYTYKEGIGTLYIDGTFVDSANNDPCENIKDAEAISIGNSVSGFSNAFNGLIDEVRIYDRALGSREVFNLFTKVRPAPSAELIWETSDNLVLDFFSASPEEDVDEHETFTIKPNNGSSNIKATVSGTTISGTTEARVFLCENPWPPTMALDTEPFHDKTDETAFTSQDPRTNFSTFYCRDKGESGTSDDLPEIFLQAEFGSGALGRSVPGLLKEVFLTQPKSKQCIDGDLDKIGEACSSATVADDCGSGGVCVGEVDAIGIRALGIKECNDGSRKDEACLEHTDCPGAADPANACVTNPENFSVQNWYDKQEYGGSPQQISLDGFSGLQDGRTIYVGAVNDTEPEIFNNIYLISMNDSAHADSVEIYNQLVTNWRFLANISDPDEKAKLHRDLIRVNDAYRIASIIENRETPVKLESGSFQKNISISTWPSWSQALSSDFGSSLPIDPINEINCQTHTNIDQTTCFDSSIALPDWQFQCEGDSPEKKARYYLYKYLDKDAREMANSMSVLQFNLEYSTSDKWSNVFIGPEWVSHPESLCANMEYVDIIPNP